MGGTNALPFPLGLQINDAATRLLPANEAQGVPIRLHRALRMQRVAPLVQQPVEKAVQDSDRKQLELLYRIELRELAKPGGEIL